eukprot:scaffold5866_cov93-Isochrysis_galbana.AAC.10
MHQKVGELLEPAEVCRRERPRLAGGKQRQPAVLPRGGGAEGVEDLVPEEDLVAEAGQRRHKMGGLRLGPIKDELVGDVPKAGPQAGVGLALRSGLHRRQQCQIQPALARLGVGVGGREERPGVCGHGHAGPARPTHLALGRGGDSRDAARCCVSRAGQ